METSQLTLRDLLAGNGNGLHLSGRGKGNGKGGGVEGTKHHLSSSIHIIIIRQTTIID